MTEKIDFRKRVNGRVCRVVSHVPRTPRMVALTACEKLSASLQEVARLSGGRPGDDLAAIFDGRHVSCSPGDSDGLLDAVDRMMGELREATATLSAACGVPVQVLYADLSMVEFAEYEK